MADDPSPRPASVPWARSDHLVTFDIAETARRAGHYRWIATQLFEILGSWVATVPEVDVRPRLAAHSHHAEWHARLWRDRLPDLAELAPDDLTVPPNDALRSAIDLVVSADTTIERLVGVYRVALPRLVGAYTFHLAHTSELSDGPTARTLSLALADASADRDDGELMIQSLLGTADDARIAADHQGRVESAMTEAGGVCGPGSIG